MSGQDAPTQHKKLLPYGELPPQQHPPVKTSRVGPVRQILRVNQACRTCRKQKMRCEGPDNPPCFRCKAAGVDCVFEKVGKSDGDVQALSSPGNVDRLNELEKNVDTIKQTQTVMQDILSDILTELQRRPLSTATHGHLNNDIGSPNSVSSSVSYNARANQNGDQVTMLPPIQSIVGAQSPTRLSNFGNGFRRQPSDIPPSPRIFVDSNTVPSPGREDSNTPVCSSAIYHGTGDATGPTRSYLGGHISNASSGSRKRSSDVTPEDTQQQPPFKRQRQTVINSLLGEDEANATHQWGQLNAEDYGHAAARAADVIDKGIVSESEARDLWQLYFSKCHNFLPIFTPRLDTFESIRERSTLCFCSILMVAAKVRDGGNEPSALQEALWKEALEEAKDVMFENRDTLERVQALMLISAWIQSSRGLGWLALGHAIRYAAEIGMHRAIPKLFRRVKENRVDEGSFDQSLIMFARVWCALYTCEYHEHIFKFDYYDSINQHPRTCLATGRPPMILGDATIRGAREVLLRHPLAQPTDARLVAASELYVIVKAVLDSLQDLAEQPSAQRETASGIVDDACSKIDKWLADWDSMLKAKGPAPDVLLQTIRVQRQFAFLTVHAKLIVPFRSAVDIENIPPFVKQVSSRAIAAAREIVEICVNTPHYNELLRYTVTHAHSSFGFAGVLLLKMTRLFHPDSEELIYVVGLVERLADILGRSPDRVIAKHLRTALSTYAPQYGAPSRSPEEFRTPQESRTYSNNTTAPRTVPEHL